MAVNDPQAPQAEQKVVQMTEAELRRLIADVSKGVAMLPPGAIRGEDGTVFRYVLEPTGRRRPVKDATGKVVREDAVYRRVKRSVYLTYDMSPQGLLDAKRKAQAAGLDFHHPQYGWLRYGSKREVDVPENMGNGAQAYDMVYQAIEVEEGLASSVTVQGHDAAEVELVAEAHDHLGDAAEELSSGAGLASFDDAIAQEEASGPAPVAPARRK